MARWHRLEPADLSLFNDPGAQQHRFVLDVPATPEQVWESLASDRSLAAWPLGPGVSIGLTWTSARPFGIGATRDVVLPLKVMTVRERFFRWDEGSGYSFYVEAANRPGLRRFAEDYAIEARDGGARLVWRVALEPQAKVARGFGVTRPLNAFAFARTAAAGRKYFATR